jgi:RND family efflux transporter MFP subunit
MKRSIAIAATTAAAALVAASLHGARATPQASATPPAAVSLAPVQQVKSAPREEIVGSLEPQRQLKLAFEISGRLARIMVKKGAPVAEGQLIAQLDPEMADAQVAQAEAAVKAAEAQAAMAQDAAQRQKQLGANGAVSESQLTNATQSALAADAQLAAAKAQLAQARATRKRHDLRAPFAGVLIDAPDQVGATVQPMQPNTGLFTVEQLDTLLLKLTVNDSARALLKPGARVQVAAVGTDVHTGDAQVRVILPSADPQTRRVPVEIAVPNQDRRFTAHTLGRAILPLGESSDALALPASALASQGGDHVYVVQNSEVRRIPVEVVDRGASQVVVRARVPLEKVVDYPAADLTEGAKVSVK